MEKKENSFLDLVKACDNFTHDPQAVSSLYRLLLPNDARTHGFIVPSVLKRIPWSPEFQIDHSAQVVQLFDTSRGSDISNACNASFQRVIDRAIDEDIFETIHGQHSEPFRILGARYPVHLERFAAPLFGIINRGAHLTVYTNTSQGMKIWVPRRSPNVFTYPNMLDSTVAGGVPSTESPLANIIREADEEASLPEDLVKSNIKACGVLTYIQELHGNTGDGVGALAPDIVYLYDLEVEAETIPRPKDDEVKEFSLMSVEEVKAALLNAQFKTNSAVVFIDFFVRHGFITEENEKDYVEIITRMHRQLPCPTSPG